MFPGSTVHFNDHRGSWRHRLGVPSVLTQDVHETRSHETCEEEAHDHQDTQEVQDGVAAQCHLKTRVGASKIGDS